MTSLRFPQNFSPKSINALEKDLKKIKNPKVDDKSLIKFLEELNKIVTAKEVKEILRIPHEKSGLSLGELIANSGNSNVIALFFPILVKFYQDPFNRSFVQLLSIPALAIPGIQNLMAKANSDVDYQTIQDLLIIQYKDDHENFSLAHTLVRSKRTSTNQKDTAAYIHLLSDFFKNKHYDIILLKSSLNFIQAYLQGTSFSANKILALPLVNFFKTLYENMETPAEFEMFLSQLLSDDKINMQWKTFIVCSLPSEFALEGNNLKIILNNAASIDSKIVQKELQKDENAVHLQALNIQHTLTDTLTKSTSKSIKTLQTLAAETSLNPKQKLLILQSLDSNSKAALSEILCSKPDAILAFTKLMVAMLENGKNDSVDNLLYTFFNAYIKQEEALDYLLQYVALSISYLFDKNKYDDTAHLLNLLGNMVVIFKQRGYAINPEKLKNLLFDTPMSNQKSLFSHLVTKNHKPSLDAFAGLLLTLTTNHAIHSSKIKVELTAHILSLPIKKATEMAERFKALGPFEIPKKPSISILPRLTMRPIKNSIKAIGETITQSEKKAAVLNKQSTTQALNLDIGNVLLKFKNLNNPIQIYGFFAKVLTDSKPDIITFMLFLKHGKDAVKRFVAPFLKQLQETPISKALTKEHKTDWIIALLKSGHLDSSHQEAIAKFSHDHLDREHSDIEIMSLRHTSVKELFSYSQNTHHHSEATNTDPTQSPTDDHQGHMHLSVH